MSNDSDESLNTGGNGFFSMKANLNARELRNSASESDDKIVAGDEQQNLDTEDALAGDEKLDNATSEDIDLDEEEDPKVLQKALQKQTKLAESAEKARRVEQSKSAILQAQLGSQVTTLNKRITQIEQNPTQTPGESISDDDIPDVGMVKRLMNQTRGTPEQARALVEEDTEVIKTWVDNQPHAKEVGEYIQKNRLDQDPAIIHSPTNLAGMYNAAEAKMLRDQNSVLEEENTKLKREFKRIKKHSLKGVVPRTNLGNAARNTSGKADSSGHKVEAWFRRGQQ